MTFQKIVFLGYPEPDAGVPFTILIKISKGFLGIIGLFNRGGLGFEDLESSIITDKSLEQLRAHFAAEGLQEVPFSNVYWLFEKTKQQKIPFPEYEIIALEEKEILYQALERENMIPFGL